MIFYILGAAIIAVFILLVAHRENVAEAQSEIHSRIDNVEQNVQDAIDDVRNDVSSLKEDATSDIETVTKEVESA